MTLKESKNMVLVVQPWIWSVMWKDIQLMYCDLNENMKYLPGSLQAADVWSARKVHPLAVGKLIKLQTAP